MNLSSCIKCGKPVRMTEPTSRVGTTRRIVFGNHRCDAPSYMVEVPEARVPPDMRIFVGGVEFLHAYDVGTESMITTTRTFEFTP